VEEQFGNVAATTRGWLEAKHQVQRVRQMSVVGVERRAWRGAVHPKVESSKDCN